MTPAAHGHPSEDPEAGSPGPLSFEQALALDLAKRFLQDATGGTLGHPPTGWHLTVSIENPS